MAGGRDPRWGTRVGSGSRDRTLHARIAAFFAIATGAIAILLIRGAHHDPALVPLAVLTGVTTAALASAAIWLSRGLMEWVIGNGRVTLRRRFGSGARAVFEADRLELADSSDGDGDRWFVLRAVAPGASALAITTAGRFRKRIDASLRDPSRPRRLGDWIARSAGIPLEDRTGREAHEAEVAQLKAQLASSGRLGRFLSRLIDRAEKSRQTG